jgi:phosphoglycolate phosphatase
MTLDLSGVTIVFDLDGTLVDTAPDLAAAANHVFASLGLAAIPPGEMRPFISHGARAMIEQGLHRHGVTKTPEELAELFERFIPYYADNVAVLSRPFEGIPELLDALLEAGARLAVCTNKYEALSRSLLRQLALHDRFVAIAGRDTFDVFKPAPGHLTRTIALAGGQTERAIMVGDSEVDIATAAAAGIPSIGVTFGYTQVPVRDLRPTAVIDHYREFMPALERALAAGRGSVATSEAHPDVAEPRQPGLGLWQS